MKRGINKTIVVGDVGAEPEVRYSPSGEAVSSFSVATTETWNDKATKEKKERTEWHRIVSFNKLAEIVRDYVKKGSKVYIEGANRTRSYDKNGEKHYITEIVAHEIQVLDKKGTDTTAPPEAGNYDDWR